MTRFLTGLALGAIAAGGVYGTTGSRGWALLSGFTVAVFIWIWPITRDELTSN